MQQKRDSKAGVIIASVAVCLFLCGYLLIKVILPLGAIKGEELDEGHIRLPNNYQILMISAVNWYLLYGERPAVEHDVDALAWDTRYVFYHLSNKKNLSSQIPDKGRFVILDTETGEIDTYETLKEAQQALNKLGTGSLELKSVMDFFPETKGSAPHEFTLE